MHIFDFFIWARNKSVISSHFRLFCLVLRNIINLSYFHLYFATKNHSNMILDYMILVFNNGI